MLKVEYPKGTSGKEEKDRKARRGVRAYVHYDKIQA